jgi:hypothetical protein
MLDTDELLARLADKGIRNVDIARVLELPDSRVPEIKRKDRRLTLDEGVKLVRAFELEQENRRTPIPVATLRLIVRYVAEEVGIRPEDQAFWHGHGQSPPTRPTTTKPRVTAHCASSSRTTALQPIRWSPLTCPMDEAGSGGIGPSAERTVTH